MAAVQAPKVFASRKKSVMFLPIVFISQLHSWEVLVTLSGVLDEGVFNSTPSPVPIALESTVKTLLLLLKQAAESKTLLILKKQVVESES